MGRIVSILLVVALLLAFPVQVFAADSNGKTTEIIHFEDGSSVTIELVVLEERAAYTKRATKTYTYRNSLGNAEWSAELIGSFRYDGETATCMSSICNVSISNTNWYVISKSATESGNTAKASLKMGCRSASITTQTKSLSMQIACDRNGNIT